MELQPKFTGDHDNDFGQLWAMICQSAKAHQEKSSHELVTKWRCAAEHPDDGWVDRKENTISLVYPPFKNKIVVGSRIALGWPSSGYRIVEVTEIIPGMFSGERYRFKELQKVEIEQ